MNKHQIDPRQWIVQWNEWLVLRQSSVSSMIIYQSAHVHWVVVKDKEQSGHRQWTIVDMNCGVVSGCGLNGRDCQQQKMTCFDFRPQIDHRQWTLLLRSVTENRQWTLSCSSSQQNRRWWNVPLLEPTADWSEAGSYMSGKYSPELTTDNGRSSGYQIATILLTIDEQPLNDRQWTVYQRDECPRTMDHPLHIEYQSLNDQTQQTMDMVLDANHCMTTYNGWNFDHEQPLIDHRQWSVPWILRNECWVTRPSC